MKRFALITPSRERFLALSPAMWVFVIALISSHCASLMVVTIAAWMFLSDIFRRAGGAGLGLFTVRRLVEDILGIRIELHSQQGAGTRFVIRLPEAPLGGLAASTERRS